MKIGKICIYITYIFFFSILSISYASADTPSPTASSTVSGNGSITFPANVTVAKPSSLSAKFSDFNTAFNFIFDLLAGAAGTVFIIMLLVGGIQYLTSMGNEEVEVKARKTLINAVIGIIVVAVSWGIGSWILQVLKISK